MAYLGHNPKGYPHPFEQPTIIFRPRTKKVHQDLDQEKSATKETVNSDEVSGLKNETIP